MSIGWPKANGRFALWAPRFAQGEFERCRRCHCASQLAYSWAAGIEETYSGSRSFCAL